MKRIVAIVVLGIVMAQSNLAQTTFPTNGAANSRHLVYAFINASIYQDAETLINKGVLLVQDSKVINVGTGIQVPADAVVIDLTGKFIYPSFIDIYSDYGMPQVKRELHDRREGPQMETNVKGAYGWNQSIKSHSEAYKLLIHNNEKADEYRKNGIGTVLTSAKDGIVRGSGVLINLNKTKENESIIIDKAAAFYSFNKGSSTQDYPGSLTGAIALLRQTYYDAQWYKNGGSITEYNISLDEFNKLQPLPQVFEANDKFNALRAVTLAKEFGVSYILKGGGNEYQRLGDLKSIACKFIIPLNFPDAYDVEDPYDTRSISLAELKHWELAPYNPALLEKNGIPFCFTTADLKDKGKFLKNIRKAIKCGLTEKTALKALTLNPAAFVNASDKIGALKKGYYANFIITSAPVFNDDAVILQHWVAGEPEKYSDLENSDIRGNYVLNADDKKFKVRFWGDADKPKAQIAVDTTRKSMTYTFSGNLLTFSFSYDSINTARASGSYNKETKRFDGKGQWAGGQWFGFSMVFDSASDTTKKSKSSPAKPTPEPGKIIYPFTAYGQALSDESIPFKDAIKWQKNKSNALLIKNATVWTNVGDKVEKETDVYVLDGKIAKIAKDINPAGLGSVKVIDGKGKHLTPGIIDEHSHIALTQGVNEGTQASSAEVRMGDVINPEDINIYRQLSGGVTTAQLLHGSANPIGGQSALIKLRWGLNAEDMKYERADGFIKFALGENVKQSNWGDLNTVRFPQSRMGVEQVYVDHFTRAREYNRQIQTPGVKFRRDLELEALGEILNKKRFITCHSYVQSEINMLMHVADSFGFKVNTFTHILEGYKVADKMKSHAVNASTFSDWWAYKNEVMEAIPHNAALLTKMGVNTCINSDDAEMARRLNQEAAKAVKYGGLSETEALKLVTLNPAVALHINDKVGTVEVGKVADLVLWTDNPLSVYAKADKTIIDGVMYFDRDEDVLLRQEMRSERARIVAKLISEKQKGSTTVKHEQKQQRLYHCNTIEGIEEESTGIR